MVLYYIVYVIQQISFC